MEPSFYYKHALHAEVPHPAGKILVSAEGLHSKRTIFKVDLPQNINGVLK